MRSTWFAAALAALSFAAPAQDKLPLKVVYAGESGTAHADEFVAFLRERTRAVRAVALGELTRAQLDGVDVLIVDGHVLRKDGERTTVQRPAVPTFDLLTAQPTVLIGGVGGMISDAHGLKTGWHYG